MADADRCTWCKRWISDALPVGHEQKATADHVIPVVDGGTDTIDNLVPACALCNSRRGRRGIDWQDPMLPTAGEEWR